MRHGILIALAGSLIGAGSALAQSPSQGTPAVVTFHEDAACGPCVSSPSMCCPQPCCSSPQMTLRADYLLWWVKDGPLPAPLVTTGTPASEGILGREGTAVLIGGSDIDYSVFSGGRLTADWWRDSCSGFQVSAFVLEQRGELAALASDAGGSPVLTRPVVDALTGEETGASIAFPEAFAGSVQVLSSSQFWGAEVNMLSNWSDDGCRRIDLILGARYLDLDENLYVHHRSTLLPQGIAGFNGALVLAPDTLALNDAFETQNRFYGGQIGAQAQYRFGTLLVDVTGKVAIGWTHEVVSITGSTTLFQDGAPAGVASGGLLALPTNIGRSEDDAFALVPELNINVSYPLSENLTARVGYTFIYWSDVVRPGEQIDRTVNPTQVPSSLAFGPFTGPARPFSLFRDSDFWAMGLNLGLELRY